MSSSIQAGTIFIGQLSSTARTALAFESEPFFKGWSQVTGLDSVALDKRIHHAGWSFFFMAAEVKTTFFGALKAEKIQHALQRIFGKVKLQHFNSLEITAIARRHFFGIPYTVVSAHSRHIQQSSHLDSAQTRIASDQNAKWAQG